MAQTAEDAATKVKTFTQLWDTLKESAQSGWTETWEILVGDFDEAKALLTEVFNTIGGIIGRVVNIKDETIVIETGSDRSKIRITRWAVQQNNSAK